MLKRLRIKFVCITMLLVTLMLCIIFAMVFQFTRHGLERESMRMMEAIGANPFHLGLPNEMPEEVRLPYFILQLSSDGKLVTMDGGYYDLSDTEFLQEVAEAAALSTAQIGILREYNLRYFRIGTPAGQRIIFADISSEQSTLNNLLKNCLLIGAASFVVFLIISLLLALSS